MKKVFIAIGILFLILTGLYFTTSPIRYEVPTRSELLRLTNIERQKVGVSPLIEDERLNKSAQIKADDMANNNYFNHVDSNGKHGYEYIDDVAPGLCNNKGENIRENAYIDKNTSAITIQAFVDSPRHYAGMTNKQYTLVGFGINGTKVVEHLCEVVL